MEPSGRLGIRVHNRPGHLQRGFSRWRERCAPELGSAANLGWCLALRALAINVSLFLVEIVAGIAGGSKALQALTLDFLGDAANDAINLSVTGMVLAWRGRAAVLEGATLGFSERTFSPQ